MATGVVKDGRVYMRDGQTGARFSVPVEDARKELATGARYESPDEHEQAETRRERGTLGQQAITAGEGALETATLGLGTLAATELGGDEYRQAALERAKENPNARIAGQVAGAVVPGLLSGGSGTAGTLSRLTPAGSLARVSGALESGLAGALRAGEGGLLRQIGTRAATYGAQGALEGAAYGLGSGLADSALEDTEWTADRALAAMGDGAIFGLGAGALAGAGSAAVTAAGRKAMDAMLGEGATLKGAVDKFVSGQTIKGVGADQKALAAITRDGQAIERVQEVGQKLVERGIPAEVEKAAPMLKAWQREAGEQLGSIAKGLDDMGIVADANALRGRVNEVVESYRGRGLKTFDKLANSLEREVRPLFDKLDARAGVFSRETGEAVAAPMSFSDLWATRTNLRKAIMAGGNEVEKQARRELYQAFTEGLDDAIASTGVPELGQAWKTAAQDYADATALVAASGRTARRNALKGLTGMDLGVGATGGGLLGILTGAATGSFSMGAVSQLVGSAIGSAASKLVRARGPEMLAKLATMAADTEQGMRSVADSLAGIAPAKAAARGAIAAHTPAFEPAQYEQLSEHLLNAQMDARYLPAIIERATAPFVEQQPEVAFAMGKRIAEDTAWLQTKLPQPLSRVDSSLTPMHEVPTVPPREQKRITSYAKALAAPKSVFATLKPGGTVDWDGLEAIKERRPELFQAMRSHVIRATAEAKEPLPFRRRVLLGTAFDFPSDWSMLHVSEIQATRPPSPPGNNGKPAMSKITTSQYDLPQQEAQL